MRSERYYEKCEVLIDLSGRCEYMEVLWQIGYITKGRRNYENLEVLLQVERATRCRRNCENLEAV